MPKPIVQALVLADHVYQDTSGKMIIAGTFNRFYIFGPNVPRGDAVHASRGRTATIERPT